MAVTLRPLTDDDTEQHQALSLEAFGPSPAGHTTSPPTAPGRHPWGAFDGGRLVARVTAREFDSWWYGEAVATTGIASVAVAAESRDQGLLARLFEVVLDEAAARGAVISTLFPTAPGIYHRLGYEVVSALDEVELPTAALSRLRPGSGITLRRATVDDLPAVRAVYDRWAATARGPLTRLGPSYPPDDAQILARYTGITLAVDTLDETVVGYVSWERGPGYDASSWLAVDDLLAVDGRAYASLWHHLGSFASVTGTVRVSTSGVDAARRELPTDLGRVRVTHPYMLRVDDVAAAVSLATRSAGGRAVRFAVRGDGLGRQDGTYLADGAGCVRSDLDVRGDVPTFTPRGLALAYTGLDSCAGLRLAGGLSGPADHDVEIDRWWGRQPVHIRDYF